jgi:hypothetical protein
MLYIIIRRLLKCHENIFAPRYRSKSTLLVKIRFLFIIITTNYFLLAFSELDNALLTIMNANVKNKFKVIINSSYYFICNILIKS